VADQDVVRGALLSDYVLNLLLFHEEFGQSFSLLLLLLNLLV